MHTIDELPAANAAPLVDLAARRRITALCIMGLGAALILLALALTTAVLTNSIADRQLVCAALFGASGALFGIVGLRMLRTVPKDKISE